MSFGNYAGAAAAIGWIAAAMPAAALAQENAGPGRAALIEQSQADKSAALHPFKPDRLEEILNGVQDRIVEGLKIHPYFESAYAGGGFTVGAGYARYVSAYNLVDLRGSITVKGYKRVEAAFLAPRLFDRRGVLTAIGGWREATKIGFYGVGSGPTSIDDRANYGFKQPYASAALDFWPTRSLLLLHGGVELSTWDVGPGKGSEDPSVDEVYTPQTLPGLDASPTYLHSEATIALDSRAAPGYARRGTYVGLSFHDFRDRDGVFGFRRTDYEAIEHLPILREAWVLSLHGRMQLANAAQDQTIPFFMLPALGGGSSLRGFASWRFRDRNSLLLQADWRVLANRFLDLALLYDAGRVSDRRGDLFDSLKSDYGVGFRFHGPITTPLRIELVRSNEGFNVVFSSKAVF
jgi:Omp85 superfamily domain